MPAPCDPPGVPGGVAAVALDRYGNFSLPLNESGPGNRTDSVVIRGSGEGLAGYRYVDGVRAPRIGIRCRPGKAVACEPKTSATGQGRAPSRIGIVGGSPSGAAHASQYSTRE